MTPLIRNHHGARTPSPSCTSTPSAEDTFFDSIEREEMYFVSNAHASTQVVECPSCHAIVRDGEEHEHRTSYTAASYSPLPLNNLYDVYETSNRKLIFATIEYVPAQPSTQTPEAPRTPSAFRVNYNTPTETITLYATSLNNALRSLEAVSIETGDNLQISNW